MTVTLAYVIAGALLIFMALTGSVLKRLPLTAAMLYLAVGYGLGPAGVGLIRLDPVADAVLLERLTEVAVIVSLFTAGLKLRLPLSDPRWRLPVRLAFGSMALTVGLIAAAGVWLLAFGEFGMTRVEPFNIGHTVAAVEALQTAQTLLDL